MLDINRLARRANVKTVNDHVSEISEIIVESVIGSFVEGVKSFFRKLKEFILAIYRAIFGGSSKSNNDSSNSSSGSSSSYNSSPSSSSSSSLSADEISIARRKSQNGYFTRNFQWNISNWDMGYLTRMTQKLDRLDMMRIHLPNGSSINTASSSIVDEISNVLAEAQNGNNSYQVHPEIISEFKSAIYYAMERSYFIADGSKYQSQIREKIVKSGYPSTLSAREISSMLDAIETTDREIDKIRPSYTSLIDLMNSAEREVNRISANNPPENVVALVNALSEMLKFKVTIVTSIEHIHIKALQDRANEYCREIRRFNNM